MSDGVFKTVEGVYKVFVRVRNGTQFQGETLNLEEAKGKYVLGHLTWNLSIRPEKEIPIYVEHKETTHDWLQINSFIKE